MTKCTICGSEDWALVERVGALETWRCRSCDKEETMHVFDPSSEPVLPSNLAPVFVAEARWAEKPSDQQIAELRALFPSLKAMSIATLKRKAFDRRNFNLGRFTDEEMHHYESKLRALGVQIERIPIESR